MTISQTPPRDGVAGDGGGEVAGLVKHWQELVDSSQSTHLMFVDHGDAMAEALTSLSAQREGDIAKLKEPGGLTVNCLVLGSCSERARLESQAAGDKAEIEKLTKERDAEVEISGVAQAMARASIDAAVTRADTAESALAGKDATIAGLTSDLIASDARYERAAIARDAAQANLSAAVSAGIEAATAALINNASEPDPEAIVASLTGDGL